MKRSKTYRSSNLYEFHQPIYCHGKNMIIRCGYRGKRFTFAEWVSLLLFINNYHQLKLLLLLGQARRATETRGTEKSAWDRPHVYFSRFGFWFGLIVPTTWQYPSIKHYQHFSCLQKRNQRMRKLIPGKKLEKKNLNETWTCSNMQWTSSRLSWLQKWR